MQDKGKYHKLHNKNSLKLDRDDEDYSNLHNKIILNLEYSIKAQTNLKICNKASKLLIKLYV